MAGGGVPHCDGQRLPKINSCQRVNAGKSHLSAVTVISSPVGLMVQLYLGTSAASISNADAAFRSSMLAAAGLVPSLELAIRISLSQVVTVPTSSRVPGMVGWSELGRVTNLGLKCHRKSFSMLPVHLVVGWHLVPPPSDVVRKEELIIGRVTHQLEKDRLKVIRNQVFSSTFGKIILSL